jgi:hypothetical protein
MSIAIVGQQKYDYQDIACVLLLLRFIGKENAAIEIEPKGGEDALLSFSDVGRSVRAEVQVKGSAQQISIESLAEWLLHFPEREASDTLIERLMAGETDTFSLIFALGRCGDAVSMYVPPASWQLELHPDGRILVRDAVSLIDCCRAYGEAMEDETPLKAARKAHVRKLVNELDKGRLRLALRRLLIVERLDEDTVREECKRLLRADVAVDQIDQALAELQTLIKTVKATGENAATAAQLVINAYRADPLRPIGYIERGDELTLSSILTRERRLLISGPPRVGKTLLARWIAAGFAANGFEVRETTDVEAAERFLLDPVAGDRLAVIDDPLGGAHEIPSAPRILSRLDRLISRLRPNRRLIVAQAQDRLLQVTRKATLGDVRSAGTKWQDVSAVSTGFSSDLWRRLVEQYAVPEPLAVTVGRALQNDELMVEPGCLAYLAANHAALSEVEDMAVIERYARREASELGLAMDGEGMKPVAMAIAISTVPGMPVPESELAFVGGSGGSMLPGMGTTLKQLLESGHVFGNPVEEPRYEATPSLTPEQEFMLEALELRRIISRTERDSYGFVHPFYRAAAESLCDSATRRSEEAVLNMVKRGIFCLSPRVATSTAKNLDWLHERLGSSGREGIVACAEEAMNSIFPAARDVCFKFLADRIDGLPAELQEKLSDWIRDATFMDLDEMEWLAGEPRIPENALGSLKRGWPLDVPSEESVSTTLNVLNGNSREHVSPERAAEVLKFYRSSPHLMSLNAALRLVSFDVGLIRAEAIGVWLSVVRNEDEELLARVFDDEHPKVIVTALRAIVNVWAASSDSRRERLHQGLLRLCSTPSAAAVVLETMLYELTELNDGAEAPWTVFASLMPQVLQEFRVGAFINDGRLYQATSEACRHLPFESSMKVLSAWLSFLERFVLRQLSSDYMIGVCAILFKLTKDNAAERGDFVSRLLKLHGTGAKLQIVAELVDTWDLLSGHEREEVLAVLLHPAVDAKWLRGAALTRAKVPLEIASAVLPANLSLSEASSIDVIEKMDRELLVAAVSIYMGRPSPLWYLGTHHAGKRIWEPVVETIAMSPSHPLFEKAWRHLMSDGDGARVAVFVTAIGSEHCEQVFQMLMEDKLRTNGNFMPQAWEALFGVAPDDATRAKWLEQMVSHASKVLDRMSDIKQWIPERNLSEFLGKLIDVVYFQILQLMQNLFGEVRGNTVEIEQDRDDLYGLSDRLNRATLEKYLEAMEKLSNVSPPQILETYDVIEYRMKQFGFGESAFLLELEAKRQLLIQERSFKQTAEATIDSWIW